MLFLSFEKKRDREAGEEPVESDTIVSQCSKRLKLRSEHIDYIQKLNSVDRMEILDYLLCNCKETITVYPIRLIIIE